MLKDMFYIENSYLKSKVSRMNDFVTQIKKDISNKKVLYKEKL